MRMPAWISITVISAVLIPVAFMSAQEWDRPGITAYLIQRCVEPCRVPPRLAHR